MQNYIEVIGFVASIFVVISILFKTNSYRGAFGLRLLNGIGSVIFVIYGILLPAYSVAFVNIAAFFINFYYILRLRKDYNKKEEAE